MTSTSSASWHSQSTSGSPLPPHNGQTTSISAGNNTPGVVSHSSSPSHVTIRVPTIPQQDSTSGSLPPPHSEQTNSISAEHNTLSVVSPSSPSTPQQASTQGSPSPPYSEQTNSISSENDTPNVVLSSSSSSQNIVTRFSHTRQQGAPAENGTQSVVSPSSSRSRHITICIPPPSRQAVPPQTQSRAASVKVAINDVSSFDVDFMTVVPKYISRYCGNSLQIANSTPDEIPAIMREFPNKSLPWLNDIPGWQSYIHPDGALYLYNETQRTFTEAKGITSSHLRLVDACMNALRRPPVCPISVNLKDIELVLQLQVKTELAGGRVVCKYYFVDHAKRTLFWLHNYVKATAHVFDGMRGVHDPSHIAHALEYQYWLHCDAYPNHRHDQVKLLKELRNIVTFAHADMIMSEKSLSPYSADDLSNILKLIKHLQVNTKKNDSPHCICVIARFMKSFSHSKFLNFHGQPCARPDADTSVFKKDTHPFHPLNILLLILDAMLFWAQQAHYEQLQRVWVDKTIIQRRWKIFSSNLIAEWTEITIYSTVMLVVDVTFLAVPNTNIQQSDSVGVIALYVSTIFITGSLIVSLLLARHIQRYGPDSFHAVAGFLAKMTTTDFRMTILATIYSLPHAMLLWGMIFFSIAFLYNVFKSTTVAMLVSVVSGCMVVTVFMLLLFWTASEVRIVRRLARLVKRFKQPAKLVKDVELEVIPDNTQVHSEVLTDSEEEDTSFYRRHTTRTLRRDQ